MRKANILKSVQVDEDNKWILSEGSLIVNRGGYVRIRKYINGSQKWIYLHHCIKGRPIDKNISVDHIDCNPFNNKKSNIRFISINENSKNKREYKNYGKLLKGVQRGSKNSYQAKARYGDKIYCLGSYRTELLAHKAWVDFQIKKRGIEWLRHSNQITPYQAS